MALNHASKTQTFDLSHSDWKQIGKAIEDLNFQYRRLPTSWVQRPAFAPQPFDSVVVSTDGWDRLEHDVADLRHQMRRAAWHSRGRTVHEREWVQKIVQSALGLSIVALVLWSPWGAVNTVGSGSYGWVATLLLTAAGSAAGIALVSWTYLRLSRSYARIPQKGRPWFGSAPTLAAGALLAVAALSLVIWSPWQATQNVGLTRTSLGWVAPTLLIGAGVAALAAILLMLVPSIIHKSDLSSRFDELEAALDRGDLADAKGFETAARDRAVRDRNSGILAWILFGASTILAVSLWAHSPDSGGSLPVRAAKVPNVVGIGEGKAVQALYHDGFPVSILNVPTKGVQSDKVAAESPRGGTRIDRHALVSVEVFRSQQSPPTVVRVPSVIGIQEGDAVSVLFQAGFAVTTVLVSTDEQPSGTVVKQSPQAGGEATPGSVVSIEIPRAQFVAPPCKPLNMLG